MELLPLLNIEGTESEIQSGSCTMHQTPQTQLALILTSHRILLRVTVTALNLMPSFVSVFVW